MNKKLFLWFLVFTIVFNFIVPGLAAAEEKFLTTPNPLDALNKALDEEKPIFLEFYASW